MRCFCQVFGRAEDTFTAVPSHLYYIIREVLKNSCRATVEHGRRTRPGEKLPPVKVGLEGLSFGCGGEYNGQQQQQQQQQQLLLHKRQL